MNPEDIYNSFKKTTADIQNLSFNSKLDNFDEVKKRKEFTSQDSGIQDLRNDSPDAGDSRTPKPAYNPSHYQEEVRARNTHIETCYVLSEERHYVRRNNEPFWKAYSKACCWFNTYNTHMQMEYSFYN